MGVVKELRLVVTVDNFEDTVAFYRDQLGLDERAVWSSESGQVVLLEAGRATLEIVDANQAGFIDEVEVGRRVAGHIRVAFEVEDSPAATEQLEAASATVIAEPTRTPWNSLNSRLDAPGDLQLTLFQELGEAQ